jgi:asparagine synthase (glutamine-hydrolysing)
MCGISGFISSKFSEAERNGIVSKMNQLQAHRGPDNDGIWSGENISLGHRRLSIIDLSEAGNQPFWSQDKRYVIVYNGELYNYKDLKFELQRAVHGTNQVPYIFSTTSDTEVVLAAFIRWGNKCLDYFNGMYAFAIYDTHLKKTIIAKDRLGVKPLYYYFGDEGFAFASEIRALLHSGFKNFFLNKDVIAEYAMYQTVFAPNTIIKGIKQLLPGHLIEIEKESAQLIQYYSINKISNLSDDLSYQEVCNKVNELLTHAVERRMISDVPFGAFLSGGIDSSALVGLMSKVSTSKINTFNVSFDESEFSESIYAKLIAKKFNTQHYEIKLKPIDFLNDLPQALLAMDHPSGDGPNTFIVSKATKNAGITMALSGIGGDELFAGYDVFKRMFELKNKTYLNAIPSSVRKTIGYFIQKKQNTVSGAKIRELLSESAINFNSAYPLTRSLFTKRELHQLIQFGNSQNNINAIISHTAQIEAHLLSAVSINEISTYLHNTLLRDTDQMSMAVALEVREPFLDYKLLEFVLSVKDEFKYPHTPKKLLTDSLGDLLPKEIINRPKMGFTLPWKIWLKNDLKNFCETNLKEFAQLAFCNSKEIENLWERFLANDESVSWSRIWHLVVLNNWIKQNNIKID